MKKTFTLILLTLAACVGFAACSDDKDEPVTPDSLPAAAQTFLSTYFGGDKIQKVEKDGNSYDVRLVSGYEIDFDATGLWTDVDAPAGKTIPAGIAPTAIEEYVANAYPGDGINEISRQSRGYEVELISGLELHFDTAGAYIPA